MENRLTHHGATACAPRCDARRSVVRFSAYQSAALKRRLKTSFGTSPTIRSLELHPDVRSLEISKPKIAFSLCALRAYSYLCK